MHGGFFGERYGAENNISMANSGLLSTRFIAGLIAFNLALPIENSAELYDVGVAQGG